MSTEAMNQALDALVKSKKALEVLWVSHHANRTDYAIEDIESAIKALRTAIQQAEAQQPTTGKPVLVQHRKPLIGWKGETLGYTGWMEGKGLDGWPHRELYTRPAPSVPDSIDPPAEDGTEYDYCSGRAAGYAEGWNTCRAAMLAAK